MSNETSKSILRRLHDSRFLNRYFVGKGIDIGAGQNSLDNYKTFFPCITSIKNWDLPEGDAQYMQSVDNDTYDFVHSSHCLEHMFDPYVALKNWIRICKPKGHLVIIVPDEDLYEQGNWPSLFNYDHKFSFTINKINSWSSDSINILDLLKYFAEITTIKKIELLDANYMYNTGVWDQTSHSFADSAIEIILQKNEI
jgi:SAM-dependent methyltransferase